jgi:oligogalacturonide lyase
MGGPRFSPEAKMSVDDRTGAVVRQVTAAPAIHHQPFFFIPAYDDAMRWLVFVSHRTGRPEVFVEERATGELIQLTDMDGIAEWSVHPSHDGRFVYFTAGAAGWRVDIETAKAELLAEFGDVALRERGMVGAAMGTTTLSPDDQWWAVKFNEGGEACLAIVDTRDGSWEVILRRDVISHQQFCPDDPGILFYAGPLHDRVWVINRDGTGNRRLHRRSPGQWVTHETWLPGRRELAFVDWPHGVRAIHLDTGQERCVTGFNAWHAVARRDGAAMVADTNFPDVGIQRFDPIDGRGEPAPLCYPCASSVGAHWNGPFPYEDGPIEVYAPQHTHPHPSFSPDGTRVVFTSDRGGFAQVYEVTVPQEAP